MARILLVLLNIKYYYCLLPVGTQKRSILYAFPIESYVLVHFLVCSMEGGELFNRIQDRTAFNERGRISLFYIFLSQFIIFLSSVADPDPEDRKNGHPGPEL